MTAVDWGVGSYERTAQMLLPAAEVLVAEAAIAEREAVLDLGCGTGSVALLAAAAGGTVTAVDPSPRLLSVTESSAAARGADVTCLLGDAAAIPAPAGAFSCALSGFGIIFASDPEVAVAELGRVLAPDGRALVTAWLPGGALGALAGQVQELVRHALDAPPPPARFAWHEPASVEPLFAAHGLTASVGHPHELAFEAASPEAYLEAELAAHPLAVTAFGVLEERGRADAARAQLLEVLEAHNESPDAFRSTSRYVVVSARGSTPGSDGEGEG